MGQDLLSLESLIPTLQLATGPVIVISGVGLLLLCMNNRIARVIDRARLVADECDVAEADELEAHYAKLEILSQRARILRASIALAALDRLMRQGKFRKEEVAKAIQDLDYDPSKPNPYFA